MSDASQGPGWWQASDGKWYPPGSRPAPAPPPPPPPPPAPHGRPIQPGPPPPRQGRAVWPWILLGAFVLMVGGCAVSIFVIASIGDDLEQRQDEALEQVTCEAIRINPAGHVVVDVTADNATSKRSNFWVDFELFDGTAWLGDGFAALNNIPSGVVDVQESHTDIDAPSSDVTDLRCRPIRVTRFASG